MLYFLLIVIAVGVLLISPAGRQILKWCAIVTGIGAILLVIVSVLFWAWDYNQELAVVIGLAVLAGIIKIFGLDK